MTLVAVILLAIIVAAITVGGSILGPRIMADYLEIKSRAIGTLDKIDQQVDGTIDEFNQTMNELGQRVDGAIDRFNQTMDEFDEVTNILDEVPELMQDYNISSISEFPDALSNTELRDFATELKEILANNSYINNHITEISQDR